MNMQTNVQFQVGRVLEARRDLKDYVTRYGRNSGGAADRRRRLKAEETKLLDLVIGDAKP